MQKLHVVGVTPELDGLILSTRKGAKSGGFVVKVDPEVLHQLAEAERRKGSRASASSTNGVRAGAGQPQRAVSPTSLLSPREMQDLLRGGWAIEEVAQEAGVDAAWVSRFASPVLAEIARVVDRARDLVFDKPRVGPSALTLAASVRRNLADRGIRLTDEEFDAGWRAHQLEESTWVVAYEYRSRGRAQSAEWLLDLDDDVLLSNNRLGTQLGHVQSARRRVAIDGPQHKPRPRAAPARQPGKKPGKKTAAASPRARARQSTPGKKRAASASAAKRSTKKPHDGPAVVDPYREELRRRFADPVQAPAPREPASPVRTTVPAPARPAPPVARPAAAPAPPVSEPMRPVAIIGPTVRTLVRRPAPRREPPPPAPRPARQADPVPIPLPGDDLPDLTWSPRHRGPMPRPEPVPVPDGVKEKVAVPLGTVDEDDDLPAETWFPNRRPTFKGAQRGAPTPPAPPEGRAPGRRRAEPLRGR